MKDQRDLVRGWLRKAESDLAAVELALNAGVALDTACFHAQQGAEKLLKAYLLARGVEFPFTHNLARLLDLCRAHDPAFATLAPLAAVLTPYAVAMRYDSEFWPSEETAREARDAALMIKAAVLQHVPSEMTASQD